MNKKIIHFIVLLLVSISSQNLCAASLPCNVTMSKVSNNFSDSNFNLITHLSLKEIEILTGRKLSLKEKFAVKLYKSNPKLYNQFADSTDEKKLEKKALWAKWLGIGSLISLIIPGVSVLAIPAAILAIVFGTATKNKVKNKNNSRLGIIFGIITLSIFLLVIALAILIVTRMGVR